MYGINSKITVRKGYNFKKSYLYILEINSKIEEILNDLSIYENGKYLILPKSYLIDDDELMRNYLRGLFMACGSVNDPKKSRYHLEFSVEGENYAKFISNLLNTHDLNTK